MAIYPVTADMIRALPMRARIAFAVRCAQRAVPLIGTRVLGKKLDLGPILTALKWAEDCAFSPKWKPRALQGLSTKKSRSGASAVLDAASHSILYAARAAKQYYLLHSSNPKDAGNVRHLDSYSILSAVELVTAKAAYDSAISHFGSVKAIPEYLDRYQRFRESSEYQCLSKAVSIQVRDDFQLLLDAATSQCWNDDTPIERGFFSSNCFFDQGSKFNGMTILQIASVIDQNLIEYLARNPTAMYSIKPRQFEELIASMFERFGFQVELTQQTRDHGRDVIAIGHKIVQVKFLIECKRYAPHHKVGLSVVQRLHGVVAGERATKGIIVTTSRLTKPAECHIEQNKWSLEGKSFSDLIGWLDVCRSKQDASILHLT